MKDRIDFIKKRHEQQKRNPRLFKKQLLESKKIEKEKLWPVEMIEEFYDNKYTDSNSMGRKSNYRIEEE